MYTAIMANGDYLEIAADNLADATAYIFARFTEEEMAEAELEIIEGYGADARTVWSYVWD